jgi:hypothetical protein
MMAKLGLAARRKKKRKGTTRPGKAAGGHRTWSGGSALDNGVIESWHSTVEFELRRIEHFATRGAGLGAGRHLDRLDRGVQHHPPALGPGHDVPVGLGADCRAGRRMSAARDKNKKAASPLTYQWLPRSRTEKPY